MLLKCKTIFKFFLMWEFYIFMWEFPTLNLYTPSVFYCTEIWIEKNAHDPKDKYITLSLPFDRLGEITHQFQNATMTL